MQKRSGSALLEVIVAALLGAIVTVTAVLLIQAQARIAHGTSERSERNDALRSALAVLHAELEPIQPAADLHAVSRDSVVARILRGLAVVCAQNDGRVYARYRGLRLPDPGKDSALYVGVEHAVPILSARVDTTGCVHAGNENVIAFTWPAAAPNGSVWLIFETGSYHLQNYALRYRRPGESRQPITSEIIDHRLSYFAGDSHAISATLIGRNTRTVMRQRIVFEMQP